MIEQENLLANLRAEVGKCVNCGFCESVCPTLPASGYRPIIGARGRVDLAKFLLDQVRQNGNWDVMISDAFYSCLDCYACLQVCPAGVNAGKVSELGKQIVTTGKLALNNQEKTIARMIVEATRKLSNPLGVRKQCASWAKGLEFDSDSDTLLYTGNMYQLMAYSSSLSRMQNLIGERLSDYLAKVVARYSSLLFASRFIVDRDLDREMSACLKNIYEILKMEGVRFNYLGEDEPYPGTLLYDFGYIDEFMEYGARLIDFFKRNRVRTIVTIDPHTYDVMKNKYTRLFPTFDFKVVYYLEYLEGAEFEREETCLALHEPCYFALRVDGYGKLHELLSRTAKVRLPARSGKRTMCCGGPDETLFGTLSNKISKERISQLKAAGEERILTACPICYANLRKGAQVEDISGLLLRRARNKL